MGEIEQEKMFKLSIDELRGFKGFENMSESMINEVIDSLFQLAIIGYNIKV